MKLHDFKDGKGKVSAHRHINPSGSIGGWVADTAFVAPTAFVGPKAQVYGSAQILDKARVRGNAKVYERAQILDNAQIRGSVKVYETVIVRGSSILSSRIIREELKIYLSKPPL
jgi:UDP-3-O-[3-hydroxymyristoyl] glucosamine N-acyltransferase